MMLNNKVMAFDFVQGLLQRRLGGFFVRDSANLDRHCILTWLKNTGVRFYVVYKRDFFNSFPVWFPKYCGGIGGHTGESLNVESLDLAVRRKCLFILFVYPDRQVLAIEPDYMKSFCLRNGLVRKQGKLNIVGGEQKTLLSLQEQTYCIPIGILKSLDEKLEELKK